VSIRGFSGWQTALADLALILFVVVAAAHREGAADTAPQDAPDPIELALGQPMAVFRQGGDADLTRWLATRELAQGEIATVIVRHEPGRAAHAVDEATTLLAEIERTGKEARLLVETSRFPETLVVIAHDQYASAEAGMARKLQ